MKTRSHSDQKDIEESSLNVSATYQFVCCNKTGSSFPSDPDPRPSLGCCEGKVDAEEVQKSTCGSWIHLCHLPSELLQMYLYIGQSMIWNCEVHRCGNEKEMNNMTYANLFGREWEQSRVSDNKLKRRRLDLQHDIDLSVSDNEDMDLDVPSIPAPSIPAPSISAPASSMTSNTQSTDTSSNATPSVHDEWQNIETDDSFKLIPILKNANKTRFRVHHWRELPQVHGLGKDQDNDLYLVRYRYSNNHEVVYKDIINWDRSTNVAKHHMSEYLAKCGISMPKVIATLPAIETLTINKILNNWMSLLVDEVQKAPDRIRMSCHTGFAGVTAPKVYDNDGHKASAMRLSLNDTMLARQFEGNDTGTGQEIVLGITKYSQNPLFLQKCLHSIERESLSKLIALSPPDTFKWYTKTPPMSCEIAIVLLAVSMQIVVLNAAEMNVSLYMGFGPTFWMRTSAVFNTICFHQNLNTKISFLTAKLAKSFYASAEKTLLKENYNKNAEWVAQMIIVQDVLAKQESFGCELNPHDMKSINSKLTTQAIQSMNKKSGAKKAPSDLEGKLCTLVDIIALDALKGQKQQPQQPQEQKQQQNPRNAFEQEDDYVFGICTQLTMCGQPKLAAPIQRVMNSSAMLPKYHTLLRRVRQLNSFGLPKEDVDRQIVELARQFVEDEDEAIERRKNHNN
eukprot:904614_1